MARHSLLETVMRPASIRLAPLALACALLFSSPLVLADNPPSESKVLGSITAESGKTYGSLDSVNGGISVQSNARVATAETVNGGISIADGAKVEKAETVNGGISIGNNVALGSAETVNGGIRMGEAGTVSGSIETVNGGIRIAAGTTVAGGAETVNGDIALDGAKVKGTLRTVNGDLTLSKGAEAGAIHVDEPHRGWWNWGTETPPRVVIGAGCTVHGTLVFEREVKLYVHESAKIGAVTGATVVRFSGESAPE